MLQNLEDPLEEDCDQILFDHFVSCWDAFHKGLDDYNEELDMLEANFMRAYEVDSNNEKLVSSANRRRLRLDYILT